MPRLGGISSDIGTKNQHLGINIWVWWFGNQELFGCLFGCLEIRWSAIRWSAIFGIQKRWSFFQVVQL